MNRLRFPADQRRVTVPVNMDQNASNKIAANAQNLYRPLPKKLESEVSFFAVVVGISPSSSFISIKPKNTKTKTERYEDFFWRVRLKIFLLMLFLRCFFFVFCFCFQSEVDYWIWKEDKQKQKREGRLGSGVDLIQILLFWVRV